MNSSLIGKSLYLLSLIFVLLNCSQSTRVIPGHAHNDYENENPLFDAINNGFISVEADVHLHENQLYVSHDFPKTLDSSITLENLYLKPLQDHISKNNGRVYPNYNGDFYLMIDFKSNSEESYAKLKSILTNYQEMLSTIVDGVTKKGPVTVFISGNRPIDTILKENLIFARLDGRPKDLDLKIDTSIMPVVSDNYSNIMSWTGEGVVDKNEIAKLDRLVIEAHSQNKKLRLWATPDTPNMWKFLLDHQVDFINTDRLEDFSKFMKNYRPSTN